MTGTRLGARTARHNSFQRVGRRAVARRNPTITNTLTLTLHPPASPEPARGADGDQTVREMDARSNPDRPPCIV